MFVVGEGLVPPAPPRAVERYAPEVSADAAPATVASCHQPPDGGAAAASLNEYGPAKSELSPQAVAVVAPVLPKRIWLAPFGAIRIALISAIHVCTGEPNVISTLTDEGLPGIPLTVNVTSLDEAGLASLQPVGPSGTGPRVGAFAGKTAAGDVGRLTDFSSLPLATAEFRPTP